MFLDKLANRYDHFSPGDLWDLSATEWMKNKIKSRLLSDNFDNKRTSQLISVISSDCLLQVDVKQVDNDGIHHVTLFATDSEQMVSLISQILLLFFPLSLCF